MDRPEKGRNEADRPRGSAGGSVDPDAVDRADCQVSAGRAEDEAPVGRDGLALRISILTGFPVFFETPLSEGMLRVAKESGRVAFRIVNLRDYTDDSHRSIDDYPYGGGPGMILKVEPVVRALEDLPPALAGKREVILLTPQGERLAQPLVRRIGESGDVVLITGRYKGLDERIRSFVTREVSLGDYILSGGEPAALVLADALSRLVSGVLGDIESAETDSFETGILDSGYYTRPEVFRGLRVPGVLLTGNHGRILQERRRDALQRTLRRRPDLLESAKLGAGEQDWLLSRGWVRRAVREAADDVDGGTKAGRSHKKS